MILGCGIAGAEIGMGIEITTGGTFTDLQVAAFLGKECIQPMMSNPLFRMQDLNRPIVNLKGQDHGRHRQKPSSPLLQFHEDYVVPFATWDCVSVKKNCMKTVFRCECRGSQHIDFYQ